MKITAAIFLFAILVLSGATASFGQDARSMGPSFAKSEFAEFGRIDPVSDGNGVFVRWTMLAERSNIGFNVYRHNAGAPELVNDVIIAGSVVKDRGPVLNDESYGLFDPLGTLETTYTIQAMALDGRASSTAFQIPRYVQDIEVELGRTRVSLIEAALHVHGRIVNNRLDLTSELQGMVQASLREPNLSMQQWVASQPGAKISVKKDGFYRVTRQQLQEAGFDLSGDSANWRLFMEGNEQAITVGAADQYFEFYGRGLDTRESDTRVYFLIADRQQPGMRIGTKTLRGIGGSVVSNNYRTTWVKKERVAPYIPTIINGEQENYWGPIITSAPPNPGAEIQFTMSGIDDTSLIRLPLAIKLQGLQGATHVVRAVLNGHDIGYVGGGSFKTPFSAELLVPIGYFVEGTNLLSLNEANSGHVSLFDSVSVRFSRKYQAIQNVASFYTPGYRKVDLTGFTTANIRVFDTTLDGNPIEISNPVIEPNNGGFAVRIPSSRAMVMYALTNETFLSPFSVIANFPSTLASSVNQADMALISASAADMITASQAWADYRRTPAGDNLNARVIDIIDIYDEFGYGMKSAASINRFLKHTTLSWTKAPSYVMFVGDSSYDPRNYEGFGNLDLVPTAFVNLIFEESGSDEALADFDHNGLAEMSLGRIPARTGSVVTTVMNKTIAFEVPAMQSLDRGVLFAYDIPSGFDFEGMSRALGHELPPAMPKMFVGRGLPFPNQNTVDPNARANLMAALNSGKYIVNYAGHGSSGLWATTQFFGVADVSLLTNPYSIFTMLTCFNGQFFLPDKDSLGEVLLKHPGGGAVATWASTTETTPDYQLIMGARFYNQIGVGQIRRLGDLVKDAKSTIAGSDVGYSWSLLGDPALQVRSPNP